MGQQRGALKLRGSHGDFTFAKTKDGFKWREKSGVTREQFLTSPELEKQRAHAAEFGATAKAVAYLREVFKKQIKVAKDRKLTPRMLPIMMAITKQDATNDRGKRLPSYGPLELLQGFQINGDKTLSAVLEEPFETTYDRVSGAVALNINAFLPDQQLERPTSATHYRITLAAAEIDFDTPEFVSAAIESPLLEITTDLSAPINLSLALTPNSHLPVFVLAGIRFSEMVNGKEYPDRAGDFNAMVIAKVDQY